MLPSRKLLDLKRKVQAARTLYYLPIIGLTGTICLLAVWLLRLLLMTLPELGLDWFENYRTLVMMDETKIVWGGGVLTALLSLAWVFAYMRQQYNTTRRDLREGVLLSSFVNEQYYQAVCELKQERANRALRPVRFNGELYSRLLHFALNYRDYKFLAGDRSSELPQATYLEPNVWLDLLLIVISFVACLTPAGLLIGVPVLLRVLLTYPRLSAVLQAVLDELQFPASAELNACPELGELLARQQAQRERAPQPLRRRAPTGEEPPELEAPAPTARRVSEG